MRGVYLTWTNCADPARHADFNRWYSYVALPRFRRLKQLVRATRYTNARPHMGPAQYLVIYEFDAPDLEDAIDAMRRLSSEAHRPGVRPDCFEAPWQDSYREIGPQEYEPLEPVSYPQRPWGAVAGRPDPGDAISPLAKTVGRAVYLEYSNCTVPAREDEWNRWYTHVRVPDLAAARGIAQVKRYRAPHPERSPSKYATMYEFRDADLAAAMIDFQRLETGALNSRTIDCVQMVARRWFWEVDADAYAPAER